MDSSNLSSVLGPQFSFSPEGGTDEADAWQTEQLKANREEYTHYSKVDYLNGEDGQPLSFGQITTIDQMFQWLQTRHPTYPPEVIMCMARAQFTPTETKAEPRPKAESVKGRPPRPAFSIERKEVEVSFGSPAIKPSVNTTSENTTYTSDQAE
jgi:hypothetical protein